MVQSVVTVPVGARLCYLLVQSSLSDRPFSAAGLTCVAAFDNRHVPPLSHAFCRTIEQHFDMHFRASATTMLIDMHH